MKITRRTPTPHPFLKWVGGKGQLLQTLHARFDEAGATGRYHEPFIGGGAFFFSLYRKGLLGRKQAMLSDNNARLVEAYQCIQENVDGVIRHLKKHKAKHEHDYYYATRAEVPTTAIARTARLIYLNKTCFNGLYRENSKGEFNVPMGRYKNPRICDEENLYEVSTALQRHKIQHQHFAVVRETAAPGDFVYFDPPYWPVSDTASFTAYHQDGCGENGQRLLANVVEDLTAKGVYILLSNSMTPLIQELYKGYTIEDVQATRMVNSNAKKRGKISEALVNNFSQV